MVDEPKVLLVDDEESITDTLAPLLERSGFSVAVAADGKQALTRVADWEPHIIVLDVLMPELGGREVLRRLRQQGNEIPVILLTKVGESTERAMALQEGADDYINKPYDPFELLARIRAVLRRTHTAPGSVASSRKLVCGDLTLDRHTRRVSLGGKEMGLRPKAVALLQYMLVHPNIVLTRERLLDAVWGWDYVAGTRAVDNQVYQLRRVLEDDPEHPRYIETVSGEGYRFIGPVEMIP